ncbi:MAG: hypothetical protein P1V20_10985 [Verrucomicrobiales bacterium]|nr:hypothetical protein [Verrucomicrobiales bacterium]
MSSQPILANLVSSSWLEIIIVGIVAGLLLNMSLRGRGYGFVGNTLIGMFGAIIGGFIWDKILKQYIDIDLGSVTIQLHLVLLALLGAGLLLLLINFLGKRKV